MVKDVLKAIEALPIDEKRTMQSEYLELVFMVGHLPQWETQLATVLGEAVKPKGKKPTKEDEAATGSHGGIGQDQTLFRKDQNGVSCVAMLWPRRDGEHITLKVFMMAAGGPEASAEESSAGHADKAAAAGGSGMLIWAVIGVLVLLAIVGAVFWAM